MIIEFDTCFVDNFDWGREKTCICSPGKLFTENTFTTWLQKLRSKYHYEFMGWDGLLLLNILHNNISKMFNGGELETNVQVIHFIINYKIMLKAVTPV